MTILIQDGRHGGHRKWTSEAIDVGAADGAIVSPFHTPRIAFPHHPSGETLVSGFQDCGGEVYLDPGTHIRLLPGTNDFTHYNTWSLWGPSGLGLDNDERCIQHIELVFARQSELGVPLLAPTLTLENPLNEDSAHALHTAQLARAIDSRCGQALAGKRSFWRSGPDLDAYVGQLATLRSPFWLVTMVNETVFDNQPDLHDTDAFVGLLRSIHSLSQRSRVIYCYGDYGGLPAIAAGADTVGSGWFRGMRFLDPTSFQLSSNDVRIQSSQVTQARLGAVLRRDAGEAITRLDPALATSIRGGPMPVNDAAERIHHLRSLAGIVSGLTAHGEDRRTRVAACREFYELAGHDFDYLIANLPGQFVTAAHKERWNERPLAVLESYALEEGL